MKGFVRSALIAAAIGAAAAPAHAQVKISLSTTGCFYVGTTACTVGTTSASFGNTGSQLTFTGNSLTINSATGGNAYFLEGPQYPNLGTFKLDPTTNGNFGDPLRFRLFVNFFDPSSAVPNPLTTIADFDGAVAISNGDNTLIVDFGDNYNNNGFENNPYAIIDYDGAPATSRFAFRVNDVGNIQRDNPAATPLIGRISCQANDLGGTNGCSAQVLAPSTTVPEPSTYALMAAGLAAVGVIARRRRA